MFFSAKPQRFVIFYCFTPDDTAEEAAFLLLTVLEDVVAFLPPLEAVPEDATVEAAVLLAADEEDVVLLLVPDDTEGLTLLVADEEALLEIVSSGSK